MPGSWNYINCGDYYVCGKAVKEQRIPFELTTYPSNEEALNRYMAYTNRLRDNKAEKSRKGE